jgi:hypothetical protein
VTTDEQFRAQLLAAAERIQAEQTARDNNFRLFCCAHLGLAPGTVCDQAESIIRNNDPKELSDEQLSLVVQFAAGLPPGYSFTEEQIEMAASALISQRA